MCVLNYIPTENSIILANTVEEGFYGRRFRNTYLNAYSVHNHYLSNLTDYHWRATTSSPERYENYMKIFPTSKDLRGIYDPSSIKLVKESRITHILLKKVEGLEFKDNYPGLMRIMFNKDWAAYKVK